MPVYPDYAIDHDQNPHLQVTDENRDINRIIAFIPSATPISPTARTSSSSPPVPRTDAISSIGSRQNASCATDRFPPGISRPLPGPRSPDTGPPRGGPHHASGVLRAS